MSHALWLYTRMASLQKHLEKLSSGLRKDILSNVNRSLDNAMRQYTETHAIEVARFAEDHAAKYIANSVAAYILHKTKNKDLAIKVRQWVLNHKEFDDFGISDDGEFTRVPTMESQYKDLSLDDDYLDEQLPPQKT